MFIKRISQEEADLRDSMEGVFQGRYRRKIPGCILSMNSIATTMTGKNFLHVVTSFDYTAEFMHKDPHLEEIAFSFRRDWSKRGYIHTPYTMFITMPEGVEYRYCLRSIGQLKTALKHWQTYHCPSAP
jgi:hypothetical protein